MFYTKFNKHTKKEPLRLDSSIFEFLLYNESDVKLSSVTNSEMDISQDGHAHSEIVSVSPTSSSDDYVLLDAVKAAALFPAQKLPIFEVDFPVISHDVAVDLLLQVLNSRFCCRRSTLDRIQILSENVSYCYHVELDTYLEKRSISTSYSYSETAYEDEFNPWEVHVPVPTSFTHELVDTHISDRPMGCPSLDDDPATCKVDLRSEFVPHSFEKYVNRSNLDLSCFVEESQKLVYLASGEHFLPGEVSQNVVMDRAIEEAIREADRWAEESHGVIRWQNLLVSVIPIRVLKYRYGGRSFQITVYGYDPKVLYDDLPRPSLLSFFCLNNLM